MVSSIYDLSSDKSINLFRLSGKQSNLDRLYFCGYEGVTYQGNIYTPIPCELTGYSVSTGGVVQPTLTVFSKTVSPLIRQYNHLLGWEIGVLKIKKSQLALTNPLTTRLFDVFTIAQKTSEIPGRRVSFKLKPRTNLKGEVGRVLNATCSWVYRSHGCEYQGNARFTATNEITTDPNLDICALTLTACRLRNNLENFSGIPTINDYS